MEKDQSIKQFEALRPSLEQFRKNMERLIKDLVEEIGVEVVSIESRTKTTESFQEKINRSGKNYDDPLGDLTDLVGVRVICYFNEDVEQICSEIRQAFSINENASVDKKLNFNELGYLSKHLIASLGSKRIALPEYKAFKDMSCEVQVRTVAQHAWAAIEHKYNYKHVEEMSESAKRRLFRIQAVLEMCDDEFSRLRSEVTLERKKITEEISQGESVPIHAESLIAFMDSGLPEYEYIFSELRKRGFSFRKRSLTSRLAFSGAADRFRAFGIGDISALEAALKKLSNQHTIDLIEVALKRLIKDISKPIDQTSVIHLLAAINDRKDKESKF